MDEGLHDHENMDETIFAVGESDEAFDEAFDERFHDRRGRFVPSFRGRPRATSFGGRFSPPAGVRTARLTTPRGTATVQMPEPVATTGAVERVAVDLDQTIAEAQAEAARRDQYLSMRQRRLAIATKAGFEKVRRQQQMTMLFSAVAAVLVQRENDQRFADHVHPVVGNTTGATSLAANKNLIFLLLTPMLPSLMGGGDVLGLKMGGQEMTNLLIAGGLVFLALRENRVAPAAAHPAAHV